MGILQYSTNDSTWGDAYCTAQLFRGGTILTGGHCISYDKHVRWYKHYQYVPISGFPSKTVDVECICIPQMWYDTLDADDYDYAFARISSGPQRDVTLILSHKRSNIF